MVQSWIVAVLLPAAVFATICTDQPDGAYEISCKAYTSCTNGKGTIINCERDLVFNNNTGKCDVPKNVGPPCGQLVSCEGKADDRYADLNNNCRSYYTCYGGVFYGHSICPAGLVFNERLEVCDRPSDVPPPCGYRTSTTAYP
ncbi:chitin-binding domain protein cbd-1-like [Gigantopelta aegis]|uniref:chitin-binding domain protein cbd-1-like n=1 Tax=Gigantopelta aegis TaxID=1735272 RepID=UPI001B88A1C7|nr:chitin-binding domain protein cbd-1-like [Gigantopelta aegis]